MDDTIDRMKAIEDRLAKVEQSMNEAHRAIDGIQKFCNDMGSDLLNRMAREEKFSSSIDKNYYGMFKNALHKYGVLKEFCETAGPIIIECDRILFPEKSIERSKRLAFVFEGNDELN
jgi:hypothetical protein